jgi:hypothetical protein
VDLVDDLDFDIDIDDFDVIQAMEDLLAQDEFRGGGADYSAIFSDADIVSHCRHGCEDGDGDSGAAAACAWLLAGLGDDDCGDGAEEEEAGSSPADSGVTDDGPLALAAVDDDDAEAMSAYVAELERFLLEDDDDDAPCGEQADGLLGVVDDYFAGDQLLATAEVVPGLPAVGGAGRTDGEEKEEEEENGDGGGGDVLAAREDDQSASRKRARYENEFF